MQLSISITSSLASFGLLLSCLANTTQAADDFATEVLTPFWRAQPMTESNLANNLVSLVPSQT